MPDSHDAIWSQLRELDDPINLERPAGFDGAVAAQRFEALVEHVERTFACRCRTDAGPNLVQDASFYGDLFVPAEATAIGEQLAVRVSNFDGIAVYAVEGFGVYDAEETGALLDAADRIRLELSLTDTDHVIVPESLLWRTYDGRSSHLRGSGDHPPTWWDRFFDYL